MLSFMTFDSRRTHFINKDLKFLFYMEQLSESYQKG